MLLMRIGRLLMIGQEAIKYAAIFFTLFPVLVGYVWIQKYFVKGMVLGVVKG